MHSYHTDAAIFGATGVVLIVSWAERVLSSPSPWLQNLAYLAAIIAAGVGTYYKVKNKGKD